MLTKFWETFGSKLAENWAARVLTPAVVFWAGGLLAVTWDDFGDREALRRQTAELSTLPAVVQAALVLGLLIGLAASALVAERATVPVLRLLEGYWPAGRPRWLRNRLVRHHVDRRADDQPRFSELHGKRQRGGLTREEYRELRSLEVALREPTSTQGPALLGSILRRLRAGADEEPGAWRRRHTELERKRASVALSPVETGELARLEWRLRRIPVSPAITMPTRLGNLLRAAEERPNRKYGLDVVAVWPQFWLVLPKDTRDELIQARMGLEAAARAWLWAALFVVWTPLAAWALPAAIAVAATLYYGSVLSAAQTYGDLVEAAFDIHRAALYESSRWPLSRTPGDERQTGAQLSEYLWRGTAPGGMQFEKHPP
jgi:hypothetical protein